MEVCWSLTHNMMMMTIMMFYAFCTLGIHHFVVAVCPFATSPSFASSLVYTVHHRVGVYTVVDLKQNRFLFLKQKLKNPVNSTAPNSTNYQNCFIFYSFLECSFYGIEISGAFCHNFSFLSLCQPEIFVFTTAVESTEFYLKLADYPLPNSVFCIQISQQPCPFKTYLKYI